MSWLFVRHTQPVGLVNMSPFGLILEGMDGYIRQLAAGNDAFTSTMVPLKSIKLKT